MSDPIIPSGPELSFADLGLSSPVLKAIKENGYEAPSPIQMQSIPVILQGKDILGQAQTGTGKTAAFALPLLSQLNLKAKGVQVLVLTPTRELAIQVAEAFQVYAKHIKGFHVLPIYGGQSFEPQLRSLKRGVHVVVGTPGRVMDHMRRKTLKIDQLKTLVLDEADEMLRMGFIDDVNWILEHTPENRQTALFSATMPAPIKKVAVEHLNQPIDIKIANKTTTAKNINQRYWLVSGLHKLDALTRVLETEEHDAVLIFVRTKMATEELAEKLKARGFAAEAMNGDMVQKQRERLVERLKSGSIDILIGTDVVARGLDVERISHVINYHIPYDVESYVHRIGRTGRAGRSGEAILFVARRERRMLKMIESTTKQPIQQMSMPTVSDINLNRMNKFKLRIQEALDTADLGIYQQIVREFQQQHETDPLQIAAALAFMTQGDSEFLLQDSKPFYDHETQGNKRKKSPKAPNDIRTKVTALKKHPDVPMKKFILQVGYKDDVKPTNIVGMIANEAGLDREFIGQIDIYNEVATVDLPDDMPKDVEKHLAKSFICGKRSGLRPLDSASQSDEKNYKTSKKAKSKKRKSRPRKKKRQPKK